MWGDQFSEGHFEIYFHPIIKWAVNIWYSVQMDIWMNCCCCNAADDDDDDDDNDDDDDGDDDYDDYWRGTTDRAL